MHITINDKEIDIPFDPAVIPVGRFIEFQQQYGNQIDKEIQEVLKEFEGNGNEEHEQELNEELDFLIDQEAMSWFTYWSGHDFFSFEDDNTLDYLIVHYKLLRQLLKEKPKDAAFPCVIEWGGGDWQIQSYEVTPESDMCFNEVITSKEVMRMLSTIEGGYYLSLKYLSAIFFRKVSEPFTDELIYDKGQRLKLMDSLPLSHALTVSFFLISSMNIWRSISVCLNDRAAILNPN